MSWREFSAKDFLQDHLLCNKLCNTFVA